MRNKFLSLCMKIENNNAKGGIAHATLFFAFLYKKPNQILIFLNNLKKLLKKSLIKVIII